MKDVTTETAAAPVESKRRFLTRQARAVGAILALVAITRTQKASATPACFLRGTLIETVDGPRAIEDLVAGDILPTHFGGQQAIQWVGHYKVRRHDMAKPWVRDALPVRIARSALAPNVPARDLYVTQGHALFIDGVLITAGQLTNGTTIARVDANDSDELEYFNIKLARHDVIVAEGTQVESQLHVHEHAANFADYYRSFGMPEYVESPCAPQFGFDGGRAALSSRLRSALSPVLDRRTTMDRLRDRLEARGVLRTEEAFLAD